MGRLLWKEAIHPGEPEISISMVSLPFEKSYQPASSQSLVSSFQLLCQSCPG
jgi:hypothetical protein